MGTALLVVFGARSLLPLVSYPPARIASIVLRVVPGDLSTFMIEKLGPYALRGFGAGVNVAALLAGGWIAGRIHREGSDAQKARRAIAVGIGFFAASLVLAFGDVSGLSVASAVIYFAAAVVFAILVLDTPLLAAIEPKAVEGDETPLDAISRSRRRFVTRAAWSLGALLAGGSVLRAVLTRRNAPKVTIVEAARKYVAPDGGDFPVVVGHSPEFTSVEDFYNVDINIVKPVVDHTDWELKIHGLMESPYSLTYEQMQNEFEVIEMAHTLTCISNDVGGDLIGTAIWRGVRLKDVLAKAKLKDGIVDVVFRGAEGYSDSIPLAEALQSDTLLVFGMNGEALNTEHGFPARIIVPNIYGMKNVKWLTEIETVATDYQGYWMVRGWSDEAYVKTQSRFDVPADNARVKRGSKLAGVAWAGDRGIRRVEISTDRGDTWKPAVLKRELSKRTWRLWAADLDAAPGKVRVMVRAVDGEGDVQTAQGSRPHPAGATGHHLLDLTVE